MFFMDVSLNELLKNSQVVPDFRCHAAHTSSLYQHPKKCAIPTVLLCFVLLWLCNQFIICLHTTSFMVCRNSATIQGLYVCIIMTGL